MSNHYHLLIHTPEGNLTRCMRHIGGVYTQYFNRRHGLDGPLFRGRYKAILVEEDEYLLGLVRYIHHNPLRAGLVDTLKDYPWSSHFGYVARGKAWDWLHKEPVLSKFADDPTKARQAYQRYMALDVDEEIDRTFSLKKLPAVLGSKEFVRKVKKRFFVLKKDREIPEASFLAPSCQKIMETVCTSYRVKEEELYRSRRGTINEPRNVAVYLVRTLRGEKLLDIARLFNMKGYSTVSSTIGRVKQQLAHDKGFMRRVEAIKTELIMSHREK